MEERALSRPGLSLRHDRYAPRFQREILSGFLTWSGQPLGGVFLVDLERPALLAPGEDRHVHSRFHFRGAASVR